MSGKILCEIFIAMNEDGDWEVATEASDAVECMVSNNGGDCVRCIKINVHMTPPAIEETELDIPDEAGETKRVEAQAS